MNTNLPVLDIRGLVKTYGAKTALADINLQLGRGRVIGLLGPNGSGKTTLIKMIAGLLTPTSGEIYISGEKPSSLTKSKVAYLPDKDYLSDYMTVGQLMEFFADFYTDFDTNRATQMLQRLNIQFTDKLKTLSKGTKEKVQLVLVMSRNAELYLLDEPIGGVDPAAIDYILDTIITSCSPNSTVVICTHLISDIEKVLDEVVFLNYGKIGLVATVDDIRERHGKSVDELFREVYKC